MLGPYSKVFPLQQELIVLLKDESADVVQGIVKNLNETLTVNLHLGNNENASWRLRYGRDRKVGH